MINRLREQFPTHFIQPENSTDLFIVDYKNINGGGVQLSNTDPLVPYVYIKNENQVPIYFDGFPENAFVIEAGKHCKQCECILFPQTCTPDDWILAVETKYAYNIENAFRESNDYPRGTVNKIIDNVNFLRKCGIIEDGRRVHAIIHFPGLIADFSAFFFSSGISIEDILLTHKIKIRVRGDAEIRSNRRIII